MLKRSLLFIVLIASLGWICYSAYDILRGQNNFTPEAIFGKEDESILIINRPKEFQLSSIEEFSSFPVHQLFTSLVDSLYSVCYISLRRDHLLIQNEKGWNSTEISRVLGGVTIQKIDGNSFAINGYKGRYHLNYLHITKNEMSTTAIEELFVFDKQASAAIISINKENKISQTKDIYFKENGISNFVTNNEKFVNGKKRSDEEIFSGVLSKNIDSYHFFERDYLAQFDSVFANGPMFQWIDAGFVEVTVNGQQAIVSDYISGQDPLWVLNERTNSSDTSWYKIPLTKSFSGKGKRYKVEYLEDFVVISTSEELCKLLISDYKLGQTIALSEMARNKFYAQLPKMVSERSIDDKTSFAKSVYKGKLMESYVTKGVPVQKETKSTSFSISVGGDIHDFHAFREKGNVVALTVDGELKKFTSGKLDWTKKLNGKLKSSIQIIDLHANGETQILVNTADEIYLFNLNGEVISGFPVKLEESATNNVKFYRWKERSYFLIGLGTKVLQLDAKGRELNIIKSKVNVSETITVWASQKKLFAGFTNGTEFNMVDLENYKLHREFVIPSNAVAIKIPNEIFYYGIKNGKLIKVDQKGVEFAIDSSLPSRLFGIEDGNKSTIAIQHPGGINLLNINGLAYAEIKIPFNEIEDVCVHLTDSGKTYVGVIDGLENNVYLYTTDGQLVTPKGLEGQKKMMIHSFGAGYRITTIIDQFIVQYFEN